MRLKIKNITWNVIFCDRPDPKDDDCIGLTTDGEHTIRISNKIEHETLDQTIIHELTHAYIYTYGFSQYDKYTDENLCDFMQTYIFDILKDYKKIKGGK